MARLPTACLACRSKKRKCRRGKTGEACTLCKSINKPCTLCLPQYPVSTLPSSPRPSAASTPQLAQTQPEVSLLDQDSCNELVDLYFAMLHDKQHALFHRPSFLAAQRLGSAPRILVLAMIALAARFSTNSVFNNASPWYRGRMYASQCKALFEARSEAVSLVSLQACILLALLSSIEGDAENESLYIAQGIRMAMLMRLPKKLSADTVQREVEIKVWWTLWMLDTWISSGSFIPSQLATVSAYQKPIDELLFDTLTTDSSLGRASQSGTMERALRQSNSLWSQMIPLTKMIPQIHALHGDIVQDSEKLESYFVEVDNIASRIDEWLHQLPERFQFSYAALATHASQGYGRTLLALHIGYHHQGQLLYWPFLYEAVKQEPVNHKAFMFADRCRTHATRLSEILWTADSTEGCECLWTSIGHLLTISSSVHLHTLLFGLSETLVSQAKVLLLQNFELMINLRRYWPSLDHCMARLRVFHQYCQDNTNNTFKMSKSMLWFLHGYRTHPNDSLDIGTTGNELAASFWEQSDSQSDDELFLWGWTRDSVQDSSSTLNSFLIMPP